MNSLWSSNLIKSVLDFGSRGPSLISGWNPVRFASKKASGGKRNPKQSPGQHRGIQKNDGNYVFPGDILLYRQNRLWFHPGLNVCIVRRRLNLVALKEGIVRITCEKPDLNFNNGFVKMWYAGREGQTFFKKYFHVIPKPQHTRFKCIDQI